MKHMNHVLSKAMAGIAASVLLISALPSNLLAAAAEEPPTVNDRGDVNGDGKKNAADIDALAELLQSQVTTLITDEEDARIDTLTEADVNTDGMVDAADMHVLTDLVAGKVKTLPTVFGGLCNDNILVVNDSVEMYSGTEAVFDVYIPDFEKDIYAYEVMLKLPEGFSYVSADCTAGGASVVDDKNMKLYGWFTDTAAARGKIATVTVTCDDSAATSDLIGVCGANIYTSDYHIFKTSCQAGKVTLIERGVPSSLSVDMTSSRSVKLSWSMPTGEDALSYCIYRDGEPVGESYDPTYTDVTPAADKAYTYTVTAIAADGVESAESLPVTAKTRLPHIAQILFSGEGQLSTVNNEIAVLLDDFYSITSADFKLKTADETVLESTVELNGNEVQKITKKPDLSGVETGTYTAEVTVTDMDGATDTISTTVSVQTTLPSRITNLNVTSLSGALSLTWGIGTEVSVNGYRIYRKNPNEAKYTLYAEVSGRNNYSFVDTDVTAGKTYSYMVAAVDKYGQEGARSEAASAEVLPDDGTPHISRFSTDADNDMASGNVTIFVDAEDNVSVSRISLYMKADDAEKWTLLGTQSTANMVYSLNTGNVPDGIYQLRAVAYDEAGNHSADDDTALILKISVDNIAPPQVTNINVVSTTSASATIGWEFEQPDDFAFFRVTVSAGADVPKIYTVKDKLGLELTGLDRTTTYQVSVCAYDLNGNNGPLSEPFFFTTAADRTGPVVVVAKVNPVDASYKAFRNDSTIQFGFFAEDESGVTDYIIEYSVDNGKSFRTLFTSGNHNDTTYKNSWNVHKVSTNTFPDGEVILRFRAKDRYGNLSSTTVVDGVTNSPCITITVDNQIPSVPTSLNAYTTDAKEIAVTWDLPENETMCYYQVGRSLQSNAGDAPDKEFTKISVKQWTDSDISANETYCYYVRAIDTAGNVGAWSKPIAISAVADSTAPTVGDILFDTVYVNEKNNKIQFITSDDMHISVPKAEYSVDGGEEWLPMTVKVDVYGNAGHQVRSYAYFPDTVFTHESVAVRLIAVDEAGNESEPFYLNEGKPYLIDNNKTELENLQISLEDDVASLSWECADLTGVKTFSVFRQTKTYGSMGKKQYVTGVAPAEGQTVYSCTETLPVNYKYTYYYTVDVERTNGNTTTYSFDPLEVSGKLTASLNVETAQCLGASYFYDVTGCEPFDEITSLTIDYGDSVVDSAESIADAEFIHTYQQTGVYDVLLTVKNAAGITATAAATVTVNEQSQLGKVLVDVTTMNGKPVSFATVYVDVGTDDQMTYHTDENGKLVFYTMGGTHTIGITGAGILPVMRTVEVMNGGIINVPVTMREDELASAKFTVTRMSLAEIKAAGISLHDPANSDVVKIDIQASYGAKYQNLTLYYDRVACVTVGGDGAQKYQVKQPCPNTFVLMSIPTEVHVLKDFFNIEMIVINNADSDFTLQDCSVSLNLPSGLTLMNANGSAARVANLPDIKGQSQEKINWIVRGDKVGSFDISANFSAVLSTFNQPVHQTFKSDTPVVVENASALSINVNLDDTILNGKLLMEYNVTNTSNHDVNEVRTAVNGVLAKLENNYGGSLALASASVVESRLTKKGGTTEVLSRKTEIQEVLPAGATFTVLYQISSASLSDNLNFLRYFRSKLEYTVEGNARATVQMVSGLKRIGYTPVYSGSSIKPTTQYMIVVKNHAGKYIPNASVSLTDTNGKVVTLTTDDQGRAIFDRQTVKGTSTTDLNGKKVYMYGLVVEAEGYDTVENEEYAVPTSLYSTHSYITMNADHELKLHPTVAKVYVEGKYGADVMDEAYQVRNTDSRKYSMTIYGISDAKTVQLMQGRLLTDAVEVVNGRATIKNIPISTFKANEKIFIHVYSAVEGYSDYETFLSIVPDPSNPEQIGHAMVDTVTSEPATISVPDDVQVIGGKTITLEFPPFMHDEVEVEIDYTNDGKATIEVSVNAEALDKDNAWRKGFFNWGISDYLKIEKAIKEIPLKNPKGMIKKLHAIRVLNASVNLGCGIKATGEIDFNTGEYAVTPMIFVSASFETNSPLFEMNFTVFFVPVCVMVSGSLELSASAGFSFYGNLYDKSVKPHFGEKPRFQLEVELELEVFVDAIIGGGLGDGHFGVGVYGSGGVDILLKILPKLRWDSVAFSAAFGLVAWIGDKSYRMSLFEWEHDFIGTDGEQPKPIAIYPVGTDENGEEISLALYEIDDPAFYADNGDWNGSMKNAAGLHTLSSNTYMNASPILCSDGQNVILLMHKSDAASRGIENASYLAYAVYNPKTGNWSAVKALDADMNADSDAVVYTAEDGIHIAYLESKNVFADEEAPDLLEYTNQMQIVTMKYDPQTASFTETGVIDAAGGYPDGVQFVKNPTGGLSLMWKSSSLTDISTEADLMCISSTADGFGAKAKAIGTVPNAAGFTGRYDENGTLQIVYTDYLTDETNTEPRLMLRNITDGTENVIAKGNVQNLRFTDLNGETMLVWAQDGSIYGTTDFSETKVLFTDAKNPVSGEFVIEGGTLLYLTKTADGSCVYRASYDAETASFINAACAGFAEGEALRSLSAAEIDNALIFAAQGSTETAANLYAGSVQSNTTDLAVSDVKYLPVFAESGATFPMLFNVRNNGTADESEFTAALYNEKHERIDEKTFETSLAPGAEEEFEFDAELAEVNGAVTYTLEISTPNTDIQPADNIGTIDLTLTELTLIPSLKYVNGEDRTEVTILVTNETNVPAPARVDVTSEKTGKTNLTLMIPEVPAFGSYIVSYDAKDLLGDEYHDMLLLTLSTDVPEYSTENNMDILTLTDGGFLARKLGDVDFSGEIDAEDAVAALKIYVTALTQKEQYYTETQLSVADVDGSGEVDAADATLILRYYAQFGLFAEDREIPSFEEFLDENLVKEENPDA